MSKGNGNVIKKHKRNNFTVVDNNILKNKELTLKGKGLLIILLSLPDNWEFNESGLTALSFDGKGSVRSGLKELEEKGYLIREQFRNEKGHYSGAIYNIYEEPQDTLPITDEPSCEKPISVNKHNKELINQDLSNQELKNVNTLVTSKEDNDIPYKEIINYLNEVLGTKYRVVESTNKFIRARWNEGNTLKDFKEVIDIKYSEWKDNEYSKYLRPSTLFGTKFNEYLNQPQKEKELSMEERNKARYGES